MFCGIIIDTFLSQRENIREIEKDKKDTCFICGLNKTELKDNRKRITEKRTANELTVNSQNYVIDKSLGLVFY